MPKFSDVVNKDTVNQMTDLNEEEMSLEEEGLLVIKGELPKNQCHASPKKITFNSSAETSTLSPSEDEYEDEMLKRAIAMSLEQEDEQSSIKSEFP